MSAVRKNVLGSLATQLASWGMSFIALEYVPSYLGDRNLGRIELAGALAGALSVVVALGTSQVLVRELARAPERTGALLRTAIGLRLALGVPACLLGLVVSYTLGWDALTRQLALIALGVMVLTSVNDALASARAGRGEFGRVNAAQLVERVSTGALLLGLAIFHAPLWQFMAAMWIPALLSLGALAGKMTPGPNNGEKSPIVGGQGVRELLRDGMPFLSQAVFMKVYGTCAPLMLSWFGSLPAVGWFALAKRLGGSAAFVPTALCGVLLPTLSRRWHEGDRTGYEQGARQMFRLLTLVAVPLSAVLALAPGAILAILKYPASFAPAVPVISLMGVSCGLWFLSQAAGTALIACDRQAVFGRATALAAGLSLPLCAGGILAAKSLLGNPAVGALAADAILEAGLLAAYLRALPKGVLSREEWGFGVRALLAALPLVLALSLGPKTPLGASLAVGPTLVLYVALCVAFRCIGKEDLMLLRPASPGSCPSPPSSSDEGATREEGLGEMAQGDGLPRITVLICTRNRFSDISWVVPKVLACAHDSFEVLVIDQSDSGETGEFLHSLADPRLRWVPTSTRGLSRARNLGASLALGGLIVCTDDDCEVSEDWLTNIEAEFDAESELSMAYGQVFAPPEADFDSLYIPCTYFDERRTLNREILGMGAHMILRKDLWERVGGWDEALGGGGLFPGAEDFDFAYRAQRLGARVDAIPTLTLIHRTGRPKSFFYEKHLFDYGLGEAAFCVKHVRCGDLWAMGRLTKLLAHETARGVWRGLRARPDAWGFLRGMLTGLARAPKVSVDRTRRVYELAPKLEPQTTVAGNLKVALVVGGWLDETRRQESERGEKPRVDIFELQKRLECPVYDFSWLDDRCQREPLTRFLRKTVGWSASLAVRSLPNLRACRSVYASGEDVGLPLGWLLAFRKQPRLVMRMEQPTYGASWLKRTLWGAFLRGGLRRIDTTLCRTDAHVALLRSRFGYARAAFVPESTDGRFWGASITPNPNNGEPKGNDSPINGGQGVIKLLSAGLEERDYPTLIEAVRGLPVQLTIAAGSPWSKFAFQGEELPENVSVGKFSQSELRTLYADASAVLLCVNPTKRACGMNVVLEGWAAGKPVLATDTEGLRSYLTDGQNATLVPPHDGVAWRAAIENLVNFPEVYEKIAENGKRCMHRSHPLESYVSRIVRALGDVEPTSCASSVKSPASISSRLGSG